MFSERTDPFLPGTNADAKPRALSLEITGRCNLKCRMCPLTEGTTSSGARAMGIPSEIWAGLVEELLPTLDLIAFTGFGEPMLHAAFGQMLQDADRHQTNIVFNTNGTIFPESLRNALLNLEYLSGINVSIDTSSAETYEDIRGGKVEKSLQTLNSINALLGDRTTVTASAVAMKSTIGTFPDLVSALAEIGISNLVIQNLHDQSREGLDEHLASAPHAAESLSRTREVAAEQRVQLHFEDEARLRMEIEEPDRASETYLAPAISKRCNIAWEMPHIDSLGGVYPCCRASAVATECMGSLAEQSFAEIWNGPKFRSFRSRMLGEKVPAICSQCTAVPVGRPHMATMGAELILEESVFGAAQIDIVARNIGSQPWTPIFHPRVGTRAPRDRASLARTANWISENRACGPTESFVAPGETAHFSFDLAESSVSGEWFALVIDGEVWLPGTVFNTAHHATPTSN